MKTPFNENFSSNHLISINNMDLNALQSNQTIDLTLSELQEIAMRQQQQIEINQQLLLAKDKRLKHLRQEEHKHQQLNEFKIQQQYQNHSSQSTSKQEINNQELKILKLKQLRNQIIEQKISNSNMYSELDLIKNLFASKERELYDAISKVTDLTKQVEQLKKLKATNKENNKNLNNENANQNQNSFNDLEKLKQELLIRNKLNEQQAKKIMQQHDLFQQKQLEVLSLDKRIEELQLRINSKRTINQQIQSQLSNNNNNNKQYLNNQKQQHLHVNTLTNQDQQYQFSNKPSPQQPSPSHLLFEDDLDSIKSKLSSNTAKINSPIIFDHSISPSPSKNQPKFATKQEIAHTYMNKFGSEAYQKYQEASKRLVQQQTLIQQQQDAQKNKQIPPPPSQQQQQQPKQFLPQSHTQQASIDSNDSSTNSTNSMSPSASLQLTSNSHQTDSQQQQQQQQISTALPSHLKLEFDKLKYLPDMVKTIKKRHSISDIEGSMHTVPPQVFQKMLEQHHKNSNLQTGKLNVIQEQQDNITPTTTTTATTTSSSITTFTSANFSLPQSTLTTTTTPTTSLTTSTLAKQQQQVFNDLKESFYNSSSSSTTLATPNSTLSEQPNATTTSIEITSTLRKKKSIIKQPKTQSSSIVTSNKRVNFDPHALLLDAAVEGELDLVIKCSTQVKSISEPNDEGITALHNSVCAGHFDVVKFLVEFGCDINYADNDGWTPLHCAASCNNLQMVKFLIEHGACIFATTISDNETAVDKCEEDEEGYAGCSEYLLSMEEKLGQINNACVYALYDYRAENDDELTVKRSDQLVILNKNLDENDGWWTAKLNNESGLIPRNYLGLYPRVKPSKYESTVC